MSIPPYPNPHGKLLRKTAIVTGGSKGIGRAIVQKFISEGAQVLIFDIEKPSGLDLPEGSVAVFEGDVTKEEDWKAALEMCVREFGKCDILVNNAGVVHIAAPSTEVPKAEYDRIMKTNITPLYHSARTLLPHFRSQGAGAIINISSISAPRPRPNLVWYAGSKGAVSSITRGLAAEFAPYNVRVNAVLPVVAETGMVASVLGGEDSVEGRERLRGQIPLGRLGRPGDVANAVAWLAGEESSFVTGTEVRVDGGRSLL
ncbi:hypothetical protein PRZ48_013741 [Zasmidium cellare]|uniref:Uncharacterized protein n=1 Tax=Zasmidium cellare TaxID=395010 RepID=A0ABR0E1Y0_ZASCE|nr:hypothetical protein PRZ48_013741 [Zasmidium cellare]